MHFKMRFKMRFKMDFKTPLKIYAFKSFKNAFFK
jgi:hypothetical protein